VNYILAQTVQSTSKDIQISDDLDNDNEHGINGGKGGGDDFDPDIDVGDYDWNSYAKSKIKMTQSDEDIPSDSTSRKLSSPKGNVPYHKVHELVVVNHYHLVQIVMLWLQQKELHWIWHEIVIK